MSRSVMTLGWWGGMWCRIATEVGEEGGLVSTPWLGTIKFQQLPGTITTRDLPQHNALGE